MGLAFCAFASELMGIPQMANRKGFSDEGHLPVMLIAGSVPESCNLQSNWTESDSYKMVVFPRMECAPNNGR